MLLTSSALLSAALLLAPSGVRAAPAASAVGRSGGAASATMLPTGGTVVAGKASINAPSNGYLTITQSSKDSIINWNSFSIGQGGTVQINNGSGATLNRVTGGSISSIDGLLSATGSVYLINPNGVIIGKTGVVNTGGTFVASTLDASNANFLAGGNLTFSGASTASVVNLGKVGSLGGDVALIAQTVENDGTITAPNGTVGLVAGQQVTLKDADNDGNGLFSVQIGGSGTSVTNSGLIEAANAELRAEQGNVYALAGNTAGVIRATGVGASDGKIWLVAEDGTTTVAGTLDAQGPNGSAGQIETSGQTVTVGAANIDAHGGQWLLDPQNIEITAAAANTISSALANSDVTEQTTSTTASQSGTSASTTVSSGAGDITLDAGASISWGSSHALTLNAYNNLNLNGSISLSGPGSLNLTAGQAIAINAPITVSGAGAVNLTYNTASPTNLTFGLGDSINYGAVNHGGTLIINSYLYTLLYKLADGTDTAPDDGTDDIAGLDYASLHSTFDRFALATDLNASGTTFTNSLAGAFQSFDGVFEGLGHTITGLTIVSGWGANTGLFGSISYGTVRDLGLIGGSVTATGGNEAGIGDLVGSVADATVANVYATGAVNGVSPGNDIFVGGLVGANYEGTIVNAFATGTVNGGTSATGADAGGLVGYNQVGTITEAYATGPVSGATAGGLVGYNTSATGSISDAFATGAVDGYTAAGGVLGGGNGAIVSNAYADANTTGQSGLTTGQLQGTAPLSGGGYFNTATALGSAFAGGTGGLYPYLKSFYPAGVQAVDGTAQAGAQVGVYVGGTLLTGATTATGANGYYYETLLPGTLAASGVKVGVTDQANGSATVTGLAYADGLSLSGGVLAAPTVTAGVTETTAETTYSALQTDLASTFGSANLTALNAALASGRVSITATNDSGFTVNQAMTTSSGNLSLTTTVGSLTIGASLTTNSTSGEVDLTSAGAISQTGGVITAATLTGSSVGSTALNEDNLIKTLAGFTTSGSGANFSLYSQGLTVSGAVTAGAGSGGSGNLSLTTTTGDLNLGASLTADGASGTVDLSSAGEINQTSGVITAATLTGQSAGPVSLNDANLIQNLGAFTTSGSGANLSLTDNHALDVTGAVVAGSGGSGNLSLTTTTGALTLGASLTADGGGQVDLTSAAAISQTAGVITATTLTGSSVGATALNQQNLIGTVSNFTAPGGFSLTNDQSLIASGVTSTGGNVTLDTAAGDLTVAGPVSDGSSKTLTLDAYSALAIDTPITVSGAGAVNLAYSTASFTNLSFGAGDSINYGAVNQGGALKINGQAYTLLYKLADGVDTGPDSGTDDIAGIDHASDTGLYALATSLNGTGTTFTNALAGEGPHTFSGVFDGLGNTITALTVRGSDTDVGLFGQLGSGGLVHDIGLIGGSITGSTAGALVGSNGGGVIASVYSTATVDGLLTAGGLVGAMSSGSITQSYSTGATQASSYVGGLVGEFDGGGIAASYATGPVNDVSDGGYAGGLVGLDQGTITETYSTASVSGGGRSGGLIGGMIGGALSQSYATGLVNGTMWSGGLVGTMLNNASITDSYATGAVVNFGYSGGLAGYAANSTLTNAYATGFVPYGNALIENGVGISASHLYYNSDTSGASSAYGVALTTSQLKDALPTGFGANWATGAGLYPYLAYFFPDGVQAITGAAAIGSQVGIYAGGVLLTGGTVSTGANGAYYELVAAGALPTGGAKVGATIAANGAPVSGLTYSDGLSLSGGVLALSGLYWGQNSQTTGETTYTALQIDLASTFGSANLAALNAVLTSTPISITGTNTAGFTLNQAITATGGLAITASSIVLDGGGVTSNGAVSLSGPVVLGDANTITASTTTFSGTVDGAKALTISGAAQFDGAVGSVSPLASLSVSGASTLNGGAVTTTGAQTYSGAATLGANTALTASTTNFGSSVDGGSALTIVGNAALDGAVGASAALSSLSIGGASTLNGGGVTTTGTQTYSGAATLGANTTLTASTVDFGSTLDGPYGLTITGKAAFNGAVGGLTELSSLSVSGTSIFDGGAVSTTGAQTYTGAATQDENTTLTAGGLITLGSTLNGKYALSLTGSALQFNGVVGSSQLPSSVTAVATDGNVTLGASGKIQSDGAILIAANGDFINQDTAAGASALKAGPTGYTVYSQDPTNPTTVLPTDTRGGLTGKDYFNDAYDFATGAFATAVPTGNHFVYGYAATLTYTANAASSVYGSAIPPLGGVVTGFVNGDTATTGTATYTTTATSSSHVADGPFAITGSGLSSVYNYKFVQAAGNATAYTITPAALTITADDQTKVYGAALPTLTVSYSPFANGDTAASLTTAPTVTTAATATSHVNGSPYAITASGAVDSDYAISYVAGSLTVTPEPITITAAANSKTYDATNGASATPTVTSGTLYDAATLAETYGSKDVGTGLTLTPTATIANASDYSVTLASANTGTITAEPITITAAANSKTYDSSNGASATPTVTSGTLYDTATLAETYGSKDVGTNLTLTPTATIANASDYSVTLASANTGTITAEPITITAVANSKTYDSTNGAAATPTLTSGTLYDSATFGETYTAKDVGTNLTLTPTATIANASDYAVTLVSASTGTITAESITITAAANSKTYNDSTSASATPTVTSGTLYDSAILSETYGSKDVGTGLTLMPAATIANAGDYSVTFVPANTGTITAEPITITAAANSKTYNDSTSASATPTVTSGTLYDSATLSETYGSKDVGTGLTLIPAATISNAGDYAVTLASANTGTITAEAITITAAANSKTYNDSTSAAATPTVTSGTLYDSATLGETYTTKDVGTNLTLTPTATIANAGDYTVTLASANTGSITAEAITITAAANSKTYDSTTTASATPTVTSGTLYDSATLAETYSSKDVGTGLTLIPTATIANAGDYLVTLASANTGTITAEPITITAAANSKTYNDSTSAAATPTVTSGTLYDSATLGEAYATKDAGTGLTLIPTAVIANAGDYAVTLTPANTGTITAEPITITASANSKTYDSTIAASATPTVTSGTLYDSATLGETYGSKDVGAGLTLIPAATIANAGDYTVTLVSANTGTITPEAITITAAANSKTYDSSTSAFAAPTVTSGTLYDSASSTLAESYTTANAGTSLTLVPTASIPDASNYTVTLASANTGTITPEAITITAAANSKTYDSTTSASAAPTITSGTLYDSASSTLAESYTTANAGTSLTLVPTASIPDASNYAVTLASANTGTITPEAITITAAANSKTYDSTTSASAAPTVTSGTLYDSASSTLAESYTTANAGTGLTLVPTASIPDASNYTVTLASVNTGTITPEAITITAAANTKTYDGGTAAAATPTVTGGVLYDSASLSETYAGKDAGTGLTLTPAAAITGASNYAVTLVSSANGEIDPKAITASLTGVVDKTYDGTTGAALGADNIQLSGVVAGDAVTAGATSAAYASANAGTGISVTASGVGLAGAQARDYTLVSTTYAANIGEIDPRAITITANDVDKFVGQPDPALTYQVTSGSFVGADSASGALTRAAGETPGDYAIQEGTLAVSANYALTYVAGQFVINPVGGVGNVAGDTPDQSGFNSVSTSFTLAAGPRYTPSINPQAVGSTDAQCHIDRNCINVPYPANLDVGPDIRFVPGL